MPRVTLTNSFHNTEVQVNVPDSGVLSLRQTQRVRKELCGITDCRCGGTFGPQEDLWVYEGFDKNQNLVFCIDRRHE